MKTKWSGLVLLAALGGTVSASMNGPDGPGAIYGLGTDMFYMPQGWSPTETTIPLSWEWDTQFSTEPGDFGFGEEFDLRYSRLPWQQGMDWDAWWNAATPVEGEPLPTDPAVGSNGYSGMVVTDLGPARTYWFYMRVRRNGVWANLVTSGGSVTAAPIQAGTSGDDVEAPAPVTVRALPSADTAIVVDWTAPGDDGSEGMAAGYELRYSAVDPGSNLVAWWNAPGTLTVAEPPAIEVPGTIQAMVIGGLESGRTYWFAIRAYDEVGNESPLLNAASSSTTGGLPSSEDSSAKDGRGCAGSAAGTPLPALLLLALLARGRSRAE